MGWLTYLLIMLACLGLYAIVLVLTMPGLYEQRFGQRPLRPGFDEWRADADSPAGRAAREQGLVREQRYWLLRPPGFFSRGALVRQTRYRRVETGEIERVEPDARAKFREVKDE